MHKTTAWPLALVYAALIIFASLYPFDGWRVQGVNPWVFVTARIPPPYWTRFDVLMNLAGYAPLGFLLALGFLRSGFRKSSVLWAALAGGLLSLGMEFLQIYLPRRVPSNMDWLTNFVGAFTGAVVAALLDRLGMIGRWSRFRERWFVPEARGALVLLVLWPWALLFPAAQPFGLGQVWERLESRLAQMLLDTPFMDWLPLRAPAMQPLSPLMEGLCVALGLLLPCLLAYSVVPGTFRRIWLALTTVVLGIAATALSAAMSYGPQHAWEWLSLPVQVGLAIGVLWAGFFVAVSRRGCAVLMLMALLTHLSLLNDAPTSAYFAQTLQSWEQGRFLHFYGLGQWLGWLWPYTALIYIALRVARRAAPEMLSADDPKPEQVERSL